jgi:hypothetical protein
MNNDKVPLTGILIAIVLGIGIAKWLFAETLTTYWVYTGSGFPAARETYLVDRASRTVNMLQQWQGSAVYGHADCVIFDAKNWSCPDAELWAQDGKVREAILSTDPRLHEVSRFRWWFARVTHWGHGPEDESTSR